MNSPDRLNDLNLALKQWSAQRGATEQSYPTLIAAPTLRLAGYHEAFPHLMMSAAVAQDPEQANSPLVSSGWILSPAVCYHAYASLQNQTLPQGIIFSATGRCFRNEIASDLKVGRRQIEFSMRELVFVGDPDWIEAQLVSMPDEIHRLAQAHRCQGTWQNANDPFFLPTAKGKAQIQKLLGTKLEYCLDDGLAIASINRHRAFFGEKFAIRLPDSRPAHSACIAFGLDRWSHASGHGDFHH